jgi:hypothetical protein
LVGDIRIEEAKTEKGVNQIQQDLSIIKTNISEEVCDVDNCGGVDFFSVAPL